MKTSLNNRHKAGCFLTAVVAGLCLILGATFRETIDASINGHAQAIVTHNTSDFLPMATHFGIQVVTPGSILQERPWL